MTNYQWPIKSQISISNKVCHPQEATATEGSLSPQTEGSFITLARLWLGYASFRMTENGLRGGNLLERWIWGCVHFSIIIDPGKLLF